MIEIHLTPELKIALELRHTKVHDGNERDRIKAVLLRSEGWSNKMISQALRKEQGTIARHLHDFINEQKLTVKNGGSEGYLNEEQTQQLIEHLCETTYLHQHEIAAYIKASFNIDYSIPGLNKWLHQHRFSYKQPKAVPHKFDPQQQAQFIEDYTALKASLGEDEPLLFMDAVHPTQATKISAGWIITGTDKPIETTGSRTRLNVIGAIQLGKLSQAVIKHADKVNGDSIIEFFKQIRHQYHVQKRIHLILDGAGYHKSKVVIAEAKRLDIVLHTLPPYSPNLNPIERLWKVMNDHARNNQYFATAKEFRQKIEQFFSDTLPELGASLDSRINDNFQRLISAS
jgi:transposase